MIKTQSTVPSTATISKTAAFIILYTASALLFGYACGQVESKYLAVLMFGPETLNIGILLVVSFIALSVFTGLVAVLVRPLWLAVSAFTVAAVAIIFSIGVYPASLLIGFLFLLLSCAYAGSIHKKIANQIKFSTDPLFTAQNMLLLSMVLLISASFALGYGNDSIKRGFIIPTEIRQEADKFMLKQTEDTAKKAGNLAPAEITAGMEKARAELDKMWTGLETQLKPYANYVSIFLGATIFITLQTILIFFNWIPPLLLSGIFPLLKAMRVTNLVTEKKEVSRLTL